MHCPKCNGENISKLSVVYEEGLASTRSTSTLVAVGNGGSASGTAYSESVSQTALSQRAAPPKKESSIKLLLMAVVGFFALNVIMGIFIKGSSIFAGILNVGYIALAIFLIYSNTKSNITQVPARLRAWEQSYICKQCGEVFLPQAE